MNSPTSIDRRTSVPQQSIHRRVVSRPVTDCNVAVIGIRLDQSPGEICWSDDISVEPSGRRLSMLVDRPEKFPTRQLVIGATIDSEKRRFTTATIQNQHLHNEMLKVDAAWNEDADEDSFRPRNLTPRIDATQFKFRYGLDEAVLSRWESIGVLQRFLVDRVLVCPTCQSIPTWREACPKCRSARYSRDRLIHHFACAHVDRADTFQPQSDSLQCPKCRATRLIVGVDFEYIDGPLTCFDCEQSGSQPTLSCLCHRCSVRFDPADSFQLDLYGYHVDRLDPLDIVASSQ